MIKVQPRARRTGVTGVRDSADGPRLGVAVSEPAEDGRANDAVRGRIAALLDVPTANVRVTQGHGRREKLLRVTGDSVTLVHRLGLL